MRRMNRKLAMGVLLVSAMIFGACGSDKNAESQSGAAVSTQAESTQAESGSVKESSEQTDAQTIAPTTNEGAQTQDSAASLAEGDGPAFHMKETENNLPADKAPNPNAEKKTLVALYMPSTGSKGLYMDFGSVSTLEPQELVNQLVEYGALPENSTVLSYEVDGGAAKLNLIGIDLNDRRKVVSVANTFIENFNLETITIIAGDETSADAENMAFVSELKEVQ